MMRNPKFGKHSATYAHRSYAGADTMGRSGPELWQEAANLEPARGPLPDTSFERMMMITQRPKHGSRGLWSEDQLRKTREGMTAQEVEVKSSQCSFDRGHQLQPDGWCMNNGAYHERKLHVPADEDGKYSACKKSKPDVSVFGIFVCATAAISAAASEAHDLTPTCT